MRTEMLRQQDEEAHRATCAARAEYTRKRTRKLHQASIAASRNLPVPMAIAARAERDAALHAKVVNRAEARIGAAEVAMIANEVDAPSHGGRARAPREDDHRVDGEPPNHEQRVRRRAEGSQQHTDWHSPLALRSGYGAQRARLSVE